MGFYNFLSRKIFLPANDIALNRSVSSKLDFLEKSQWWSHAELEAFQEERLKMLIKHAYENVPFYRERFDKIKLKPFDIKSKSDLHKIPVLKKEEIRSAFPDKIVSINLDKKNLYYDITSGSTGKPLQYYHTQESHSMWIACGIRAWSWMGYNLGDTYAKLSQNPRSKVVKKIQDKLNRSFYYFIEHLAEEDFNKVCDDLNVNKPDFIRCYPDPLYFLSKHIKQKGINIYTPKAINTTGNILFPEARQKIEETFNAPVYDSYSCEGGPNISQAPCRSVYLSAMEYSISECLDEELNEVEKGSAGKHIVTDLWNYATPFIRYDSQDVLVKSEKKPTCGRELEPFDKILGRDSDILITPDGRLVIVHIFTIYFEWKKSVDQFQAIQHTETDFEILLKVNSHFSEKEMGDIQSYWMNYFGAEARLEIKIVDNIEPAPSGKRKFLIRNKNIKLQV